LEAVSEANAKVGLSNAKAEDATKGNVIIVSV
jgi:hypothetical protein